MYLLSHADILLALNVYPPVDPVLGAHEPHTSFLYHSGQWGVWTKQYISLPDYLVIKLLVDFFFQLSYQIVDGVE